MKKLIIFLLILIPILLQGQTAPYRIKLASSTYTAQLRGVAATATAGLIVQGAYSSTLLRHEFGVATSGLYELWFDILGGSNYTKDIVWSGSYGKPISGYDFSVGTGVSTFNYFGGLLAADTNSFTTLGSDTLVNGDICALVQLGIGGYGGGGFMVVDSGFPVDKYGIFASATTTKQWVRVSDVRSYPGEVNVYTRGLRGGAANAASNPAIMNVLLADRNNKAFYFPSLGTNDQNHGIPYFFSDSIVVTNDCNFRGDNDVVVGAKLTQADNYDGPIFSVVGAFRLHLSRLTFSSNDTSAHVERGNSNSLVRFNQGYLSKITNCFFYLASGNAVFVDSVAVADILFEQCIFNQNRRWAIVIEDANNTRIINCDIEYNGIHVETGQTLANNLIGLGGGVKVLNNSGGLKLGNTHLVITESRFEGNRTAISIDNTYGAHITHNTTHGHFFLGDNTTRCRIEGNTFLNRGKVFDAGFLNTSTKNAGVYEPFDDELEYHFPNSILSDSDMSLRHTTNWTATNATIVKEIEVNSNQRLDAINSSALQVLTSDDTAYVYQDVKVANLASLNGYVYWWSKASDVVVSYQIKNTSDSIYYQSSSTSMVTGTYGTYSFQNMVRDQWYNNNNIDTLRFAIRIINDGAELVWIFRADLIPSVLLNGSFEGTYTAGVAAGWDSVGSGTVSEETTIVKKGSSAQKIITDTGENLAVFQLLNARIYNNGLYMFKASIYPLGYGTGTPVIFAGWGSGAGGNKNYNINTPLSSDSLWSTTYVIFRPSEADYIFLRSASSAGITGAVFDDLTFFRLKTSEGAKYVQSSVVDLSATADTVVIYSPDNDYQLRRISIVYTEATDGNTGKEIKVGKSTDDDYYLSVTSATAQSVFTTAEQTIGKTDIREGVPIIVSHEGGKTGAGEFIIIVEYD